MTYCLGIKVKQGLIAISDTLITSGNETTTSKKITTHSIGENNIFIMTSGLRSIRDKAVTYFEEILEAEKFEFTKMHQAVTSFGQSLRRVAEEDKKAIEGSGLFFNLNSIVGGKLEGDKEVNINGEGQSDKKATLTQVIIQICLINIVFSFTLRPF